MKLIDTIQRAPEKQERKAGLRIVDMESEIQEYRMTPVKSKKLVPTVDYSTGKARKVMKEI